MRVRILNDDGTSRNTKVLNAETGEEIEHVVGVTFTQFTVLGEPIMITVELEPLSLDITGVVSFVRVCPYCGETIKQEGEGTHDTEPTTTEDTDGSADQVE